MDSTKCIHNYKKGTYFLCWSFPSLLSDSCPFPVLPVFQDLHFPGSLNKWFWRRFGKREALLDYVGVGKKNGQVFHPLLLCVWWHLWHWLCSLHNTSSHGIIIPIYFRSHKTATERFQLPWDGSPWALVALCLAYTPFIQVVITASCFSKF